MTADRIRHIKCDETKPSCLKCTSTGRVCDGYEPRASIETANGAARAKVVPGYPTSVTVNPSLGISGTQEESGLFENFYYWSGRRISVVLNSKLVYQLVLQTYHSDKAVRSSSLPLPPWSQAIRPKVRMVCLPSLRANSP